MDSPARNTWITAGVLLAIGILALILVARILFADLSVQAPTIQVDSSTQGVSSAIDSAALIQANERLLQLVQWTLGLLITVGGLLVGYSWFQNRSNREEDERRFDKAVDEAKNTYAEKVQQINQLGSDITSMRSSFNALADEYLQRMREAENRIALAEAKAQLSFYRAGSMEASMSAVGFMMDWMRKGQLDEIIRLADTQLRRSIEDGGLWAPAGITNLLHGSIDTVSHLLAKGIESNLSKEELQIVFVSARKIKGRVVLGEETEKLVEEWATLIESIYKAKTETE